MLHLSPAQYDFLLERFEQETFGKIDDLDIELEIIGAGLDATLHLGAVAYETRFGFCFAFYRLELQTFVDGGFPCPNDFDPERFIHLYRLRA